MEIYIEWIFILNYLLDFIILYGTKRLLNYRVKVNRLLLGSLFGACSIYFLFISISSFYLFLIKIIMAIIIIIITFGFKNFFKNLFYFYFISICIGGSIYLLDIQSNYTLTMIMIFVLSIFIIFILYYELNIYKNVDSYRYIVKIYYHNKLYELEGFLDTGNMLKSPYSGDSILLVDINIPSKRFIYIPFKALNNTGVIPCIRPDRVVINNTLFNNCLIGLAKDKFSFNHCSCILPNKFKEKLC